MKHNFHVMQYKALAQFNKIERFNGKPCPYRSCAQIKGACYYCEAFAYCHELV